MQRPALRLALVTLFIVGLGLITAACGVSLPPNTRTGLVGGRVLLAPGIGLAGAHVSIDQVNLYDGKGEIRKHVGDAVTDEDGYFTAVPTGTVNGLILFDASGGTFTDLVTGRRVQLDASTHLKAVHWLGIFEDRGDGISVTPVHALAEARFRYKVTLLHDTTRAVTDAYQHINSHFGGLDWERVIPADLTQATLSPTDEVRAAFVLGGLAVLADDIRTAINSTPQVVNLMTLAAAAELDIGSAQLDGDDANVSTLGSGLQVGDCPAVDASCAVPPSGCQLGACRPACDVYANTYRNLLASAISKFIGPKASPTLWNRTGLGSEDARVLITSVTGDTDPDLFGDACADTLDRVAPTISWDVAPIDGALVGSMVTLRVHAVDNDSNKLPTVAFQGLNDTDGDPTNDVATTTLDTRAATGRVDGPLTVTAIARDIAGNTVTAIRTFEVDNTPPQVAIESSGSGVFVDEHNVWWSATPGPTLHGTVTDLHPGTVQLTIGGSAITTATVSGTTWTAKLPDNALSTSGNDVAIVATDAAGNTATVVQTVRLDTTPPALTVDASPVFDEINSTFDFVDNAGGSFAVHRPGGTPVDLGAPGACSTIHKYAHLLSAPNADGTHRVLGSTGVLNPLAVNAIALDDGVGIQPGSLQYHVLFNRGGTLDELLPWTAIPVNGAHNTASLFVDGSQAVPQLATTNGEYHVELRATDRFGRTSTAERCWNHVILAPPLGSSTPGSPGGEFASGFQRALFSTSLKPQAGETGDVAAKVLNASAAGAAVWRARFKNYLGLPVYVTVQIAPGLGATISRQFKIMNSLTAFRSPPVPIKCGGSHCVASPAPTSDVDYDSLLATTTFAGLRFKARLFQMAGNETGAEVAPLTADDATQTYVFLVPARTALQGSPLTEYGFLTYLVPTQPAGSPLTAALAPADASHPDTDPAPYTEFTFGSAILTGKIMGPVDNEAICVAEEFDVGGFFCTQVASRQMYRALVRLRYELRSSLDTAYSFAAAPSLVFGSEIIGRLPPDKVWDVTESVLP